MTTKTEIEQLIKESDQLINDLGWTIDQAREHLVERYNKRSRSLLDINEWADYLQALREEKMFQRIFPPHARPDLLALVEQEVKRKGLEEITHRLWHLTLKCLSPAQLDEIFFYLHAFPSKGNTIKENSRLQAGIQ